MKKIQGFTIVELIVVIAIIALLATMSLLGWRAWQTGLAKNAVKSDLKQAAVAMESAKNLGSGYPTSLPSNYKGGSSVIVTYRSGDSSKYCIDAVSQKDPAVVYHIDTTQSKEPQLGTCASLLAVPASPNPVASGSSTTAITVTWTDVAGATSYEVRYGTGTPSTLAGCTGSPCTISGLTVNTTYNINVIASNASGSSPAAATSAITQIPAPSAAGVTYTTSRVKVGTEYYQRYVVTTSGGTCSIGSTEWKIGVTGGATPNWSSVSWQSSNTKTIDVPENGIYSPTDVTIFVKPRCISGSNATEGTPAYTYNGSGGGAGGSL